MNLTRLQKLCCYLILLPALFSSIFACTPVKNLNYFNNLPDSTVIELPSTIVEERLIEKGDEIDIQLTAADQAALAPFNRQLTPVAGLPTAPTVYLVDSDGMIQLPVIGKIGVSGLTNRSLKDSLTRIISNYVKDPIVITRLMPFKVLVMGEVRTPGAYSIQAQNPNLLDVLAAAGDIPRAGKRKDIHLIREYNGKRTITKINLTDKDVLYNPPYYRAKPNDVVYVQTRKGAIFREDFYVITSFVTLAVSLVTLAITINDQ